jgi:hypothetical protein
MSKITPGGVWEKVDSKLDDDKTNDVFVFNKYTHIILFSHDMPSFNPRSIGTPHVGRHARDGE